MRRNRHISILLAVIAALLFVSSCDDGPKYNWYESYEPESDQPYGTMVINKLLTDYSKDGKLEKIDGPMHDRLQPSQADGSSAYVFIGRSLFLSEQGADTLLDFVKRGNKALISAKGLPEQLINELSDLGCTYETYGELTEGEDDSTAHLNFYHPQFKEVSGYDYSFFIQDRMMEYTWFYFKTGNICDTGNVVNYLGYMGNHKVNFIRIPYGKGEFLLHSTPLVFTNYYMVSKKGVEYADKVFSHLVNEATGEKPALTVYWDSYHNMPMYDGEEGTSKRETPLRFLLSQQTLKWALYLTLILLLVYIVFRSKRKQRVIPVLEEKENTSLEFVQTIGTLYFLQNEHRKLALQKMKLFLQYIRNRYSIPTNNMNEETLKKISIKSQVPQQQLSAIMEQYQWIEGQPEISDQSLISFHKSIDNFYKTCK